jgi:hypothetical protein
MLFLVSAIVFLLVDSMKIVCGPVNSVRLFLCYKDIHSYFLIISHHIKLISKTPIPYSALLPDDGCSSGDSLIYSMKIQVPGSPQVWGRALFRARGWANNTLLSKLGIRGRLGPFHPC